MISANREVIWETSVPTNELDITINYHIEYQINNIIYYIKLLYIL